LSALLALALISSSAFGIPDNWVVAYEIHATPADPESPIVFAVELTIVAEDSTASSVGWRISSASFVQLGSPEQRWLVTSPYVDTADGLWWVNHADPENSERVEFDDPPLLEGLAFADVNTTVDLEYAFDGVVCDSSCGNVYNGDAAALDYQFVEEGSATALREGASETVSLVDDPDPIYGP